MENLVKYKWYKSKVPTKKWNEFYSKTGGYTFLTEEGKETWIGFLAVDPPLNCLEITNEEELLKIQRHREAINSWPQPLKKIK